MIRFLYIVLILFLFGCSRSDSGGEPPIAACDIETDLMRFDENDYFTSSIRPEIMNQDYLAIYQWHLNNTGQKSGSLTLPSAGWDLNVSDSWRSGVTGKNITIGIVDTGVDARHVDLKPSLDLMRSYNYKTKTNNPSPVATGEGCAHGTATAGIAAAKGFNGGIGVMGVAPDARIVGLNIGLGCGFNATSTDTADALGANVNISSNSWGCPKNSLDCISQVEIDTIKSGVKNGRDGKGTIYIFSAGNDARYFVDANYQSGTNGIEVISVAAMNAHGSITSYSNSGSNLLVSAFGGDDPRIVTTDISGCDKGFDSKPSDLMPHKLNSRGEYTHKMNGTSAAAPMVAGVVALMLEAKPTLTYRDVRYILATTTLAGSGGDWRTNGAGHSFSHIFGFGLVDATAAVNRARLFLSLPAMQSSSYNQSVNQNTANWNLTKTLNIPANSVQQIEYVDLIIDISGTPPSKLKILLTSPSGMQAILSDGKFAFPNGFFDGGFSFGSNAFLDENSAGNWRLDIESNESKTATLKSWELKFKGH